MPPVLPWINVCKWQSCCAFPKATFSFPHQSQCLGQGQCVSGHMQTAVFTPLSHQLALVSFLQTCIHTEYSIVALHVHGVSVRHLHPAQGSVTHPGDLAEKLAE